MSANPYDGRSEVCDTGTVHLTARPGHRASLCDGVWRGQTAGRRKVTLRVAAGRRALAGFGADAITVADSSGQDTCGYALPPTLFVGRDGLPAV